MLTTALCANEQIHSDNYCGSCALDSRNEILYTLHYLSLDRVSGAWCEILRKGVEVVEHKRLLLTVQRDVLGAKRGGGSQMCASEGGGEDVFGEG